MHGGALRRHAVDQPRPGPLPVAGSMRFTALASTTKTAPKGSTHSPRGLLKRAPCKRGPSFEGAPCSAYWLPAKSTGWLPAHEVMALAMLNRMCMVTSMALALAMLAFAQLAKGTEPCAACLCTPFPLAFNSDVRYLPDGTLLVTVEQTVGAPGVLRRQSDARGLWAWGRRRGAHASTPCWCREAVQARRCLP